jgi:hypothetical protein
VIHTNSAGQKRIRARKRTREPSSDRGPSELCDCLSSQVHERAHTGDRPYRCDFPSCGKAFATGNLPRGVLSMDCFHLRAQDSRSALGPTRRSCLSREAAVECFSLQGATSEENSAAEVKGCGARTADGAGVEVERPTSCLDQL